METLEEETEASENLEGIPWDVPIEKVSSPSTVDLSLPPEQPFRALLRTSATKIMEEYPNEADLSLAVDSMPPTPMSYFEIETKLYSLLDEQRYIKPYP